MQATQKYDFFYLYQYKGTRMSEAKFPVLNFKSLWCLNCFQWNSVKKQTMLHCTINSAFYDKNSYLLTSNLPLWILSHPHRNGSSSLIFLALVLAQTSCTHCPQSVHSTIMASSSMSWLAFDINAQHDIPSNAHSSKCAPNGPGRQTAGTTCRNEAYLQS